MNAFTPDDFRPAAPGPAPIPRAGRADGWTPDRQQRFLEAISEGHTVHVACAYAGMSSASAYAFRRRAGGAAFALGWQAASLLARDAIADRMLARALEGQEETVTRPNGDVVVRHRHDNRLAMQVLARLDRCAEQGSDRAHREARQVAQEFDAYLTMLDDAAGPAGAHAFLAARPQEGDPRTAIERADRFDRFGAALPRDVATDDLDPADRAHWSAEQWVRAEAAGLLRIAPDKKPSTSQLSQLCDGDTPEDMRSRADDPVWWCFAQEAWRTSYPPPAGFIGHEEGTFGDDYERALSADEEEALEAPLRAQAVAQAQVEVVARDAFFGFAGGLAAELELDAPEAPEAPPPPSPARGAPDQPSAEPDDP
jgi:hypothetical protein